MRKAADSGAFLFSTEANTALALLLTEWDTEHPAYQDRLDSMQFEAKQCLKRMVDVSKKDLSLNKHLLIWK